MSRRAWKRKVMHPFAPELSWDESAVFCRRRSQYEDSWQHGTPPRTLMQWLRSAAVLRGSGGGRG